jgi:hypothetical protein
MAVPKRRRISDEEPIGGKRQKSGQQLPRYVDLLEFESSEPPTRSRQIPVDSESRAQADSPTRYIKERQVRRLGLDHQEHPHSSKALSNAGSETDYGSFSLGDLEKSDNIADNSSSRQLPAEHPPSPKALSNAGSETDYGSFAVNNCEKFDEIINGNISRHNTSADRPQNTHGVPKQEYPGNLNLQ